MFSLVEFRITRWMIVFGNNFGLDAVIELYMIRMTFCGIDPLDLYTGLQNQRGLD
jgi:hypothetical protein